MWKKIFNKQPPSRDYHINDYKELLRYVNFLASHKLGYPVSLLTYLGIVDNKVFGIEPNSIANILLNNVGDPFKDSETSLLEVKKHERAILSLLEKYYGMEKNETKGYLTTGGTEGNFAALWWSKRYLINNGLNKLIESDNAIKLKLNQEQEYFRALSKIPNNDYSNRITQLENIVKIKDEIAVHKEVIQQLVVPTIFYSKESTHYSVPKIAEILRFNIKPVGSNDDGSIDLQDLRKEVLIHVGAHVNSPIIVIANIGTTISGAIDNVPEMKKVLEGIKADLNYTIHMDGALMGFVLPILKPFGDVKNYISGLGANTLAFSAHKYPGLSQPCGIVLANKPFFEKAFEKSERTIEYVGNILDYTISGSRSGLNVLMFYNVLCTLDMDKDSKKLKEMVQSDLSNARYLRTRLTELFSNARVFYTGYFNVSFPRPSLALAKKYQLMLSGDKATICVLSNVTTKLIDEFITDLILDREKVMNKTKPDHTITTLTSEHEKAAIDIFTKSFCDSEPLTHHLKFEYSEYEPFAKDVIQKAIAEGLSKVALDNNKKVIACAIAEDMANPFKLNINRYPKMKPIITLMDELSHPFTKDKTFFKRKILHIWIAAVDQTYRGLGLSTEIDMTCVQSAAQHGFDFAYAEFTNDISEKVTKQFKVMHLCNKIKFSDFKLDGQTPFKGLAGEASSYVATIKPGLTLEALSSCYEVKERV